MSASDLFPEILGPDDLPVPDEIWTPLDGRELRAIFDLHLRGQDAEFGRRAHGLNRTERAILSFFAVVYAESLSTIKSYAGHVCEFFNHAARHFDQAGPRHCLAWVEDCRRRGLAKNTITLKIAAVQSFYKFAHETGMVRLNPTTILRRERKKLDTKSITGHVTKVLSFEERDRLMACLREQAHPRDLALIWFMYGTALRSAEAISLRWGDLFQADGRWGFDVTGKGGKVRRVYVPRPVLDMLMRYRQGQYGALPYAPAPDLDGLPIFANQRDRARPITYAAVHKLIRKWGLAGLGLGLSPHWLRHTSATHMARLGAKLEEIKEVLGHESLETTLRYDKSRLDRAGNAVFDGAL